MFTPTNSEEFSNLAKIFENSRNLFGNKLLDKSRSLLPMAKSHDEFVILTELLIRSHDCFLQSCSMAGISNVLQTSRICATKLEKVQEFNIMVFKF